MTTTAPLDKTLPLGKTGLIDTIAALLRDGEQHAALLTAALSGIAIALASNLINNLPAGLMAASAVQTAQAGEHVTRRCRHLHRLGRVEMGAGVVGAHRRGDAVALAEKKAQQQRADTAVVVDDEQVRRVVGRIRGVSRRHEAPSRRCAPSARAIRRRTWSRSSASIMPARKRCT